MNPNIWELLLLGKLVHFCHQTLAWSGVLLCPEQPQALTFTLDVNQLVDKVDLSTVDDVLRWEESCLKQHCRVVGVLRGGPSEL